MAKLTRYQGRVAGFWLPIFANRGRTPEIRSNIAEQSVPTRNINLTEELDHFVEAHVSSGQYANASEVFRAGLRALGDQERLYEAKLERLRSAIDEGDAAEDDDYTLDGLIAELEHGSD